MCCEISISWVIGKTFDTATQLILLRKYLGLRPLACWDYGNKSRRAHGCVSLVSVLCYHVGLITRPDKSYRVCLSFFIMFLLAIGKNTIYKLMWWLYKLRYDILYYYDVVGYSSSDVTSGAQGCCDVNWFFHGWRQLRKRCWGRYVEYDLSRNRVHLLWLWEFWIWISAWWLCWTCWCNPTAIFLSSI